MGTFGTVKLVSDSLAIDEVVLAKAIDSLLYDVNMGVSTYIENSTVSLSNTNNTLVKTGVKSYDQHFDKNLIKSFEIMEATNGVFNVFIKPLVDYWGFGDFEQRNLLAKDSATIDSIAHCIAYGDLLIEGKNECRKMDFSAIAKGYGVDVIAYYLESLGIQNYMVEIGGEVHCKGKNADGNFWRLGIEEPNEEMRSIYEIVQLDNKSMATSGNYRNFKILESGQKVVHIINPKTGYPEISNLLSASIIADDCMSADAYATACMVMGVDTCFQFLLNHSELEGYLIYSDEKGLMQVKATQGFKVMLVE